MWRARWLFPPVLALTIVCGASAASRASSHATAIAPAPRFTGTRVLAALREPAIRAQLGIGPVGPHAFLAAMRLGMSGTSLVLRPPPSAGSRARRTWDLVFIDHRAAADRRTTGDPRICSMLEMYLSPIDGRRGLEVCSNTMPTAYATLPAPGFGVAGLLHDLRCGCYANGPTVGHLGVGPRGYLVSMRYGRIADLFPRNPMGKPVQGLRIWSLTFVDPGAKSNGTIGPPGTCSRVGVGLRAANGIIFSGACYP